MSKEEGAATPSQHAMESQRLRKHTSSVSLIGLFVFAQSLRAELEAIKQDVKEGLKDGGLERRTNPNPPRLHSLFSDADSDGNGMLNREEAFAFAKQVAMTQAFEIGNHGNVGDCMELNFAGTCDCPGICFSGSCLFRGETAQKC